MSVKVTLRVKTLGAKPGDVVEVESAEIADHLVANGLAYRAAAKKAEPKPDKG